VIPLATAKLPFASVSEPDASAVASTEPTIVARATHHRSVERRTVAMNQFNLRERDSEL
jgi:hypothetical protein